MKESTVKKLIVPGIVAVAALYGIVGFVIGEDVGWEGRQNIVERDICYKSCLKLNDTYYSDYCLSTCNAAHDID